MAWTIKFDLKAEKEFKKLPRHVQKDISSYFVERILTAEHPRQFGKPLKHDKSDYWRYRVGSYRIICRIEDNQLVVLVMSVGHRSKIYD